ncbi:MAG: ABC transporter permease [Burkholderiaceae bacterium]|jgi:ABC-2 type transport system permease protein
MSETSASLHTTFLSRWWALTHKEFRQLLRDRSNVAIGLVLPIVLILLFGYGISLDVQQAAVAVVLEDASPDAAEAISGLQLSPYLRPIQTRSMAEAQALMAGERVDAILRIPSDFAARQRAGHAVVQLIVHGTDAATARIIESYVGGALARARIGMADRAGESTAARGVVLETRLWFNAANNSTWYLVPGLIVLIVTLVGAFLTSLVVAREWERGTLEALFVTPVRPTEILLAKLVPYFVVGAIGFAMCLAAARWLFEVPMMGSVWLIVVAAMLYLLVALGIGLLISSATKNQFLASQVALLSSFLPAMMLSGFLFDLRNVPAVVRSIAELLPATHFLRLLKTLFLAGNVWQIVVPQMLYLVAYAAFFLLAARLATRKRLA